MLTNNEIKEVGTMIIEGYPYSQITSSFRIGTHTLQKFRNLMAQKSLSVEQWMMMSDQERQELCYPSSRQKKMAAAPPVVIFEQIYKKLYARSCHYSIKNGWIEYLRENPDGLRYSQFVNRYRQWEQEAHPGRLATAPIDRQPGKYLYIDWMGDQPALIADPQNPGRKQKAHFLVFTMGYSSLTYAAAFPDEKTASVIEGINRALDFYGALPGAFRPDNMKTAVTSNTKEGIVLSTAMEDLQDYYDVPVLPARPLAPRDKATAERAVLILETELLPRLEKISLHSFQELNHEIENYLADLNTRIKSGETRSREELFNQYDLPNMKALPPRRFSLPEYKKLKVQRNCHIKLGRVYFSVPYQYIGMSVIVKIIDDLIEICDSNNKTICTHQDPCDDRLYVTVEEHLKSNYQKARNLEHRGVHEFIQKAERIGPSMKKLIETVIQSCKYEEQSFNTCSGILHACDGYSKEIAESAAQCCLKTGHCTYHYFVQNLKELVQKAGVKRKKAVKTKRKVTSDHANIRGEDYYR